MLAASGEARFTDVMERALYNGINSGMSLDGTTYCYRNPLAFDPSGDSSDRHSPEGKIRNPWYDTTCCPPNLERTLASLPGYFYSTSKDGVYVHFYDNSEMNWHLHDGTGLKIEQRTNYPWDGDISMTVSPEAPSEFTVYIRIPGWSVKNAVKVNGTPLNGAKSGEYLAIRRRWSANDKVELSFDMTTHLLKANPAVNEDRGRVAFQRGPIVFCMEHLDQPNQGDHKNLTGYRVDIAENTAAQFEPHLLDGVMVLDHPGYVSSNQISSLYYSAKTMEKPQERPISVRLIPYYAWASRNPSAMQVWIPYERS